MAIGECYRCGGNQKRVESNGHIYFICLKCGQKKHWRKIDAEDYQIKN